MEVVVDEFEMDVVNIVIVEDYVLSFWFRVSCFSVFELKL